MFLFVACFPPSYPPLPPPFTRCAPQWLGGAHDDPTQTGPTTLGGGSGSEFYIGPPKMKFVELAATLRRRRRRNSQGAGVRLRSEPTTAHDTNAGVFGDLSSPLLSHPLLSTPLLASGDDPTQKDPKMVDGGSGSDWQAPKMHFVGLAATLRRRRRRNSQGAGARLRSAPATAHATNAALFEDVWATDDLRKKAVHLLRVLDDAAKSAGVQRPLIM